MKKNAGIFELLGLAVLVAVIVISWMPKGALAFDSPVSPVSPVSPIPPPAMPSGLENCPVACIEVYACVGRPTCARSCVAMGGLDVEPEYWSPLVVDGQCVLPQPTPEPEVRSQGVLPQPTPEPTKSPEPVERSVWQDHDDLWMGEYWLMVDQFGNFCIPDLAECKE